MTEEHQATESGSPVAPETTAAPSPAPAPSGAQTKPSNPYIWGTGRRKSSIARVRIRPGSGKFMVNKRELRDYFRIDKDRGAVQVPLKVTKTEGMYDVFVNVHGGGTTGQSGAIVLGLARALEKAQPELKMPLKEHRLLSRDPRKVERKKYGQRGARRRFQFSKR